MTFLFELLLSNWEWLAGFVMLIVGFFSGKFSGQTKQNFKTANETLEAVKEATRIENTVDGLSDDDVDRVLRDNGWFRK